MPAGEPASTLTLLSDHCGHYSQNSLYMTHIQFYKFTKPQGLSTSTGTDVTTQESVSGWQAYSLFYVFSYTTSIFVMYMQT